jgi:hypothetical protein
LAYYKCKALKSFKYQCLQAFLFSSSVKDGNILKHIRKKKRNPTNAAVIAHIFDNYEIKSVLDTQDL